jgi:hypothetical protein
MIATQIYSNLSSVGIWELVLIISTSVKNDIFPNKIVRKL